MSCSPKQGFWQDKSKVSAWCPAKTVLSHCSGSTAWDHLRHPRAPHVPETPRHCWSRDQNPIHITPIIDTATKKMLTAWKSYYSNAKYHQTLQLCVTPSWHWCAYGSSGAELGMQQSHSSAWAISANTDRLMHYSLNGKPKLQQTNSCAAHFPPSPGSPRAISNRKHLKLRPAQRNSISFLPQ